MFGLDQSQSRLGVYGQNPGRTREVKARRLNAQSFPLMHLILELWNNRSILFLICVSPGI